MCWYRSFAAVRRFGSRTARPISLDFARSTRDGLLRARLARVQAGLAEKAPVRAQTRQTRHFVVVADLR